MLYPVSILLENFVAILAVEALFDGMFLSVVVCKGCLTVESQLQAKKKE